MRTYAISFNGNHRETRGHKNLVDTFDSSEIAKLSALDAGQKLHFNDGTVAACVEAGAMVTTTFVSQAARGRHRGLVQPKLPAQTVRD